MFETHQYLELKLQECFSNPKLLEKHQRIGDQEIDGILYEIWEGESTKVPNDRGTMFTVKITSWLDPQTGDLGRVKYMSKSKDGWALKMELENIERNIVMHDEIFSTEVPEDYTFLSKKENASVNLPGASTLEISDGAIISR